MEQFLINLSLWAKREVLRLFGRWIMASDDACACACVEGGSGWENECEFVSVRGLVYLCE